jgi:enterochelin esterase-like enzyme
MNILSFVKKYSQALILLFFIQFQSFSQISKVYENLSLPSKILNGERKYAIYLPPNYENSQRSYPVLYLLHGGGDDQTGWVQFGEVQHITDKAVAEGVATDMIIVMPDANTGTRGYFNSVRGNWNYEDFFFKEFMPFIEKTYRIKAEKRFRAIAGLSMGGGGTFMYALHHPELFSSACPLSASVGPVDLKDAETRLKRTIPDATEAEIKKFYETQNALFLVNNIPDADKKAVKWYIDCGDDDFLYEMNSLMHIAMRKKEIPHEFRIRDGGHTWKYWRTALPTVLGFISDTFHQN